MGYINMNGTDFIGIHVKMGFIFRECYGLKIQFLS